MKVITVPLYQIDELPEKVKKKAIENQHDINVDHDWWDTTYDFFTDFCKLIGVTVDANRIWFRGFYSQGDGSGFEASFNTCVLIKAIDESGWKVDYPEEELDVDKCPVNARVIALIKREIISVSARIEPTNRETSVKVLFDFSINVDSGREYPVIEKELSLLEDWLDLFAGKLNRLLYRALRDEYEYLTSEDVILERIRESEYWFTSDGKLAAWLERLHAVSQTNG